MERIAAVYFSAQGIGVILWWAAILLRPTLRQLFFPSGTPEPLILAFVLPDMAMLGAASLATAWGIHRRASWLPYVIWLQAGASVYAGLLSIALIPASGGGCITGALLMMGPLVAAPYFAWKIQTMDLRT